MSSTTLISPPEPFVETALHAPTDIIDAPLDCELFDATNIVRPVKPIRVAQVVYRWSRCGLELQLAGQVRRFGCGRIEPWIASSMPPEPQVPDLPESVAVWAYDRQQESRSFRDWLADRFCEMATDVVHARGLWMLPEALAAARKAGDVPVVFSFHGFDDASRCVSWWRRRRWQQALHQCAAVVTVSKSARADLARTLSFPEDRIQVILNGVDTDHFQPTCDRDSARKQLGIHDDRPILLCVGSLMPVKGYDVLIESVGRAIQSGRLATDSAHLIIVGTDHLAGRLGDQAQRQLAGMDVRFVGAVSDVRQYYAAADALLMPSRSEGLSNVVLEAMACGLPVVASAVGGLSEQVVDGQTGWLVPSNDSDRLAGAICELLDNPAEAQRRGRAGRQRVTQHFLLAETAWQLESLYADLHGIGVSSVESRSAGRLQGRNWPLNDDRLRWYAYARVAWWHLLASMRLEPGDNILMPDLICDVMTEPVRQLGLVPRYYTSEPLRAITAAELAQHVDERTRAVLAVHYFGMPRELDEVAAYCRKRRLPLIEDASQTMLTCDESHPVGRHGDAVLFSFRKILGLPHGAGLICNNAALQRALAQTPVPLSKPGRDIWRYWAKQLDQRCFGGYYEKLIDAIRARRLATCGDVIESPSSSPDPFDRCLVRPGWTARWLASRWDIDGEIRRRREMFAGLARRWADEKLPGTPLLTILPPGWVPYAFVINPDESGAEIMTHTLQSLGIPAEPWPRLPDDIPRGTACRRRVLIRF